MALGKLDIHIQRNGTSPVSLTRQKKSTENKLKIKM
jgi:hypothetical protein